MTSSVLTSVDGPTVMHGFVHVYSDLCIKDCSSMADVTNTIGHFYAPVHCGRVLFLLSHTADAHVAKWGLVSGRRSVSP